MAPIDENNAKLVYDYTKDILSAINSSYDAVTGKLTTILGFSGLLLRFTADLSDKSWLVNVKIMICSSLVLAIICCGIGLHPIGSGNSAVDPDLYLHDKTGGRYGQTEEKVYIQIGRGLSKTMKSTYKIRAFRLKCLMLATYLVGLASIGFAISIVGKSVSFPS